MLGLTSQYGWWMLAVTLSIAEIFLGTFYLLIIALALLLTGIIAWLGAGFGVQLFFAALASVCGAWLLYRFRPAAPRATDPDSNPDLNLDIGQTVSVERWEAQGLARIGYRGSIWQAELMAGCTPHAGLHRIHAITGSRLILVPVE